MGKSFDVVIPVAGKDTLFMRKVVYFVRKNLRDAGCIYALTNKRNISKLSAIKDPQFVIIDENQLVEGLSFQGVKETLTKAGMHRPSRSGWYFQQLLKLAFAKSVYAKKYYLTWDSDTLPLNPICFFDDEHPLFTKKIECHQPYFETMERLLGFGKIVDFSFIAEHMLFNTSIVNEMLSVIERSQVNGATWFAKIINACDFSIDSGSLFSEFEIYGNYCMKYHPNLYKVRQLNTFRAAGMIRGRYITKKMIERLAIDVTIASFEQVDAPFPYNIGFLFSRVKRKVSDSILNYRRLIYRGGKLS